MTEEFLNAVISITVMFSITAFGIVILAWEVIRQMKNACEQYQQKQQMNVFNEEVRKWITEEQKK